MMKNPARKNIRKTSILLLCILFIVQALTLVSFAEDDEDNKAVNIVGRDDNYSAVLYDNKNGLPTSEANTIEQTQEGFIWIGAYSGLIRYDGNTFERLDSSLGIGSVVSLHVDQKNRLWIGTNESGLALMENGELRFWNEKNGFPSDKVCSIDEDDSGIIYAGTTDGIAMIMPDMSMKTLDDPKAANKYIEKVTKGSDGLLYCLSSEDDYFIVKDGEVTAYTDHTESRIKGITSIIPDPDNPGMLYVGTDGTKIYYINPKKDISDADTVDISPLHSVNDLRVYGGRLWICARDGIGVLDGKDFTYVEDLPMDNSIGHVMEDYEGNLWFTSTRQGVMKLVTNQFTDIFYRFGLEERVVNTTCMYKNRLFIGTDNGLIVTDDNGVVDSLPLNSIRTASGMTLEGNDLLQILDGNRIRSIIEDSNDYLWISIWRGAGLMRYNGKDVTVFTQDDGLLSNHIRAVAETPEHTILVAMTGGVCVIQGDKVIKTYGREDGIENIEILTVVSSAKGDIVLGTNGAGIYIITDDEIKHIGKSEGLTSGIVMRIKRDRTRGIYWIVTSNSLAYMTTGNYQLKTVRKFPYSNNYDIYENKKGDMWVLSSNGIYVTNKDQLMSNDLFRPVYYGIANGLPCTATGNSYSELTDTGDLYIAGTSGVAKVNIETPMEDVNNLKQAVPYIEADDVYYYPDENGRFTLSSKVQKLTVFAYVYNYSLTDPKVSYKLEGFEKNAVTVNRSELAPVTYTNLPGGTYRFIINTMDAMGRGDNELAVEIIKEKAVYEQTWFYILTALFLLLIINAAVREYVRRKMAAVEKKHREEAERERISNELQMAALIQESSLPQEFPPFPERDEFDIYAVMHPAKEVGGDFYDFFLIDDDHLCLVMADVSGKGVPASLVMMVSKFIIQSFASMDQSAASILTNANESLCSNNRVDMFVTIWLGILEISTGKMIAANAGHEYPVIRRAGRKFELFRDKHGLVVGAMEGVQYKDYEIQFEPGDKLFVYTDGVPEAADANHNMFGNDRMIDALNIDPDADPYEIMTNVRNAIILFTSGAEQFDDVTMLCLEYKGKKNGL